MAVQKYCCRNDHDDQLGQVSGRNRGPETAMADMSHLRENTSMVDDSNWSLEELRDVIAKQQELVRLALYLLSEGPAELFGQRLESKLERDKARAVVQPQWGRDRAAQPGVIATSGDTERLAHQSHRPDPSVLRQESESHIDSFAK